MSLWVVSAFLSLGASVGVGNPNILFPGSTIAWPGFFFLGNMATYVEFGGRKQYWHRYSWSVCLNEPAMSPRLYYRLGYMVGSYQEFLQQVGSAEF